MKCDKAQEFFSDYIEDTLDRPMVVALESHLSGCDSCRADVANLRSMWTLLDEVPQVEPPADFVWRTTTRLQNEFLNRKEAERAQRLPWWKRITPVQSFSYAAIAALLAVGLTQPVIPTRFGTVTAWGLLFHQQQAPEPPQFAVQAPGANGAGAVVTIRTTTELPGARVWTGYMTPDNNLTLVGRPRPLTAPQDLKPTQVVTIPVQGGGAYATKIQLMTNDGRTFEKVLLLPGAPLSTTRLVQGDAYFALQQVAARTGQVLLVDGGLGRVSVDLGSQDVQQVLTQVGQQTGTHSTPLGSNVLAITR